MIDARQHGPWALIAGASEGLGAIFAQRFAAQGINLLLLARSGDKLDALAERLRSTSDVEIRPLVVDLTTPDMLQTVAEATEGLEIGSLIYVAGAGGTPYPLIDQPLDEAMLTINLNVVGQTLLARHVGKGMAERGRGAIVLVGSLGCVAGSKRLAVYTASKAYTQLLAEGLWAELTPMGVDVAGLLIGRTGTPKLQRSEFGKDSAIPVADPADIVDFALENLQDGPIIVPPDLQQSFEALRSMPRRKAVNIMTKSLDAQTS
ncbi:SDR family NAD(P)-dependent oxidoreductase [Erythrobacter alti]|uniref:SDR family NAD(P)-dependent oxidoreductase n=1 Tax=Erythrobacter alti TaxID=1896145 RepID=UPI0030F425AC